MPYKFRGKDPVTGNSIFRFNLSANTDALALCFGSGIVNHPGGMEPKDNLFDGALESGDWSGDLEYAEITKQVDGLRFDVTNAISKELEFSREFNIPAEFAGRGVMFEMDFKNLNTLPTPFPMVVQQFDAEGRLLPSDAIDPRWIGLLIPANKTINFRQPGRLDRRAAKIRICLRPKAVNYEYDLYGRPIEDVQSVMPKFIISRLELRGGDQLTLQPINSTLQTAGVTGDPSDLACLLDGRSGFLFNANQQAVWSVGTKLSSQDEIYWPLDDGTLEFWVKPDNTSTQDKTVLVEGYNFVKKVRFNVEYDSDAKEITATLYQLTTDFHQKRMGTDVMKKLNEGQNTTLRFKTDLAEGKWAHLAFCWSWGRQFEAFVDGKPLASASLEKIPPPDFTGVDAPDQVPPHNVIFGQPGGTDGILADRIPAGQPFFTGAIDNIRLSKSVRYSGRFKPAKRFALDADTLALFDFDHTLDGHSAVGTGTIDGTVKHESGRLNDTLFVGTRPVRWIPEELPPSRDPDKLIDSLNYPNVPATRDFFAARVSHEMQFSLKPGETKTINLDETAYMDYIEIACPPGGEPLKAPILLNDGDVDPRSYGDIADSMKLDETPTDREKIVSVFNMLQSSVDYFMTHEIYIPPFSRKAERVEQNPMSMLNGYCAFECGPQNIMAVNLFAGAAGCPATQTAGNAHLFEQVFCNGHLNLYDMSSQTFFPSRDQENPASLDEIERDLMILGRVAVPAGPRGFMRLGRRRHIVTDPVLVPRYSYTLRPGEFFRVYWSNNGLYNDLQRRRSMNNHSKIWRPGDDETRMPEGTIAIVNKPFPHFSTGIFRFSGNPSGNPAAFCNIQPDSFCFKVESPYPVVRGIYKAVANGKPVKIEVSDDLSLLTTGEPQSDGAYLFDYPVRARHGFYVRVNAPLPAVSEFSACTMVQVNPRRVTGGLRQGDNRLTFKADAGPAADITVAYRTDTKPIVFNGGLYSGGMTGWERCVFPLELGRTLEIPVTGAGAGAVVSASDNLNATFNNGCLKITASGENPFVGTVTLRDGNAVKALTVIAAKIIRLARVEEAELSGGAMLLPPDECSPMPLAGFESDESCCTFRFDNLPEGDYAVFSLSRPPHIPPLDCRHTLEFSAGGQSAYLAGVNNLGYDFRKADYGKNYPRFKWDFPLRGLYPSEELNPIHLKMDDDGAFVVNPLNTDTQLAAVMIFPTDNPKFTMQVIQTLLGLNYDPDLLH